jgi:hypothetical protein
VIAGEQRLQVAGVEDVVDGVEPERAVPPRLLVKLVEHPCR